MSFDLFHDPIIPANPAGLTSGEMQRYLGVGKNNVSAVARRFGIGKLHGLYPEPIIWRQLFGIAPEDEDARAFLREPLADCLWVSQATGVPRSTLRGCLRSGDWQYDDGVQLGKDDPEKPPRLRRWIPALIRTVVLGSPAPAFATVTPNPKRSSPDQDREQSLCSEPAENTVAEVESSVFSALFATPGEKPDSAENNNSR